MSARRPRFASPRVESLEDRLTPSSSLPLSPTAWTFMGPAPLDSGASAGSGRVSDIAAHPTDPNTYYVATASGGVWKTTNGGTSWAPLTDAQATLFTGALALAPSSPNTVYVGTGEATLGPSKLNLARDNVYPGKGILKSVDGGATWALQAGPGNAFDRRTFSRVIVHPTNPNTVYATVGNEATNGLGGNTGVWKTVDGGTTWTNVTAAFGLTSTDAYSDLVIDPSNANVLYAAVGEPGGSTANGVYKTTDGGATWTKLGGGAPDGGTDPRVGRVTLAIAKTNANRLYVAVAESGASGFQVGRLRLAATSTNGGTSWTTLGATPNYMGDFGDYNTALAVDPTNELVVYAAGQLQILKSSNGGASWSNISSGVNGVSPHVDHHALVFDASNRLVNGNDGGVWRLNNATIGNIQWGNLNTNLATIQVVGVAQHPNSFDLAFIGNQDNGTSRFTDALNWNTVQGGDGGQVVVEPNSAGPTVYHTYQYPGTPFIERSTNGGASWLQRTSGITTGSDIANFYPPLVLDPSNVARLLTGTNFVYLTSNRGDSWTKIGGPGFSGWGASQRIDAVAFSAGNANVFYASAGGVVYVTTNAGATWTATTPVAAPPTTLEYRGLVTDPQDATGLTAYVAAANFNDLTGGSHVWRTTNGGATWTPIGTVAAGLPNTPTWSLALDPRGPGSADDVLYAGTDTGLFATSNLGVSWAPFGSGLPNVQVLDLDFVPGLHILSAGTHGRGVWQIFNQATDLNWAGGALTPSTPATDTDTTFTASVTYNVAAGPVPDDFTISYFASKTGTFGSADPTDNLFLGSEVVTSAADKAVGSHLRTSPPLRIGRSGTWTLIAVLDPYDNLTETSEANNILVGGSLTVTPGGLGKGDGLLARYYPNTGYVGTAVVRTDATVDFNWASGQPGLYLGFAKNGFGVRWNGQIQPQFSETYTFYTTSDDGVRLFVNGQMLVNNFTVHNATMNTGTIALTAGQKYDIWIDSFENTGVAQLKLEWSSASVARQVIPQDRLFTSRSTVPVTTIADWNNDGRGDLWVFLLSGTTSGQTEVRILSGATNFTTTLLSATTALHPTDLAGWAFDVGDLNGDARPDLWAIKKNLTGSGRTEIHVLNGATNFGTFLFQVATLLHETDATWQFQVLDFNGDGFRDLAGFKKAGTGSGKTEVHVLNGANNFQSFAYQSGTAVDLTGDEAVFRLEDQNNDGVRDLYYIKKNGTGSGQTEVRVLNGVGNFQSFLLTSVTALHPTFAEADFALGRFDANTSADLFYVKRFNAGADRIEVHVLNGSTAFASFLTNLATVHPASGPLGAGPSGGFGPLGGRFGLLRLAGGGDALRDLLNGGRKRYV